MTAHFFKLGKYCNVFFEHHYRSVKTIVVGILHSSYVSNKPKGPYHSTLLMCHLKRVWIGKYVIKINKCVPYMKIENGTMLSNLCFLSLNIIGLCYIRDNDEHAHLHLK